MPKHKVILVSEYEVEAASGNEAGVAAIIVANGGDTVQSIIDRTHHLPTGQVVRCKSSAVQYVEKRKSAADVVAEMRGDPLDKSVRQSTTFASDWVTNRPPNRFDTDDISGNCVEVTYTNGLLGLEPLCKMRNWKAGCNGTTVIAWREIREAYSVGRV